jgi:hypothetical protein
MSDHPRRPSMLGLSLALLLVLLAHGAYAEEPAPTGFQLALWNPIQLRDSERSVRGFRYSLFWGVNRDISGLDISTFANKSTGNVRGYQTALVRNAVEGDVVGWQDSMINQVGGDFSGVQLAYFCQSVDGHVKGVQWAIACSTAGKATGLQFSGLANLATRGRGVQVASFLNLAEDLKGLQLGLLNFNKNGFLPFFPFFNFGL